MCKFVSRGLLALVVGGSLCVNGGICQAPPPQNTPEITFVLADGSQLTGTVLGQDSLQVRISTNSFISGASLASTSLIPTATPPVSATVYVKSADIASCSIADNSNVPITVAGHVCAVPSAPNGPSLKSGLQKASLSVGYVGSAQRDESAKSTVTFAGYEKLQQTGTFRGKTYLFLNGSYDDKWKSTPRSSNITQFYEGLLTQSIYTRLTHASKCSSDDYPLAVEPIGHAYHNNSQGIRADHSYGVALSRSIVLGKSSGTIAQGCRRAASPYSQRVEFSADIRSVNYILYSPGTTLHGVGSQLQASYSKTFHSNQTVDLTIRGVPVYNNLSMSQAAGLFIYVIPFKPSWALQFSVSDNYYEIAPKTFNKNYVNAGVGVTFTPAKLTKTK